MISSNNCRQLVAGHYDVLLSDDHHPAAYKSVLKGFLDHFRQYELELENKLECCGYIREFKLLKEQSKMLKENKSNLIDGELDVNQKKNRYKDIIPFNHTRVMLSGNPEARPGVNYINANYIRGPSESPKAYIACQGPLTSTLDDFWRMIWECNVSVVIMACNEYESGKPKCEIYWPDEPDASQVYGDIQVKLLRKRQINADFLLRKFSIRLLEQSCVFSTKPFATIAAATTTKTTTATHPNGFCNLQNQHQVINIKPNQQQRGQPVFAQQHFATINMRTSNTGKGNNLINGSTGNSSTSNESINGSIEAHEQPPGAVFVRPGDDHLSPGGPTIAATSGDDASDEADTDLDQYHHLQGHQQSTEDRKVIAERIICQFHYTTWPDHGVPESVHSILELVRLFREVQPAEDRPILVHCSAGCGRTGTLCCIDYVWGLMRRCKLDQEFSLFKIISDMRQQRMAMVQTLEQYILCHRAVAALFMQQLQLIEASDGEENDDAVHELDDNFGQPDDDEEEDQGLKSVII